MMNFETLQEIMQRSLKICPVNCEFGQPFSDSNVYVCIYIYAHMYAYLGRQINFI